MTMFLASVALAFPGHAQPHRLAGCKRTYTVEMGLRAIHATYDGAGPSALPVGRLRRYWRCQRNPRAVAFVQRATRHARAAWWAKAYPRLTGPVIASWYDDGGSVGCPGGHVADGLGIAALNVPCGARVLLVHGRARVMATRDDSGPYVGGRTFDLNAAVKAALGCDDLCSVRYAVVG